MEEEASANGLKEHLVMRRSRKGHGNEGVERRRAGDVCRGEEKKE